MPDLGQQARHLVQGLVDGANWRATKFASPVPPQLTCSLCRVISRTTFFLPCFHTLCESCVNHSVEEGGSCPLDDKRFISAECQRIQLPANAAENLLACCWNEAHGCSFVGTLQEVLTHYEQQCTFHAVSCPRCNDQVLQKDLPRHCRSGCSREAIGSATATATPEQGVNAQDMRTCLEELKALIRDPYQDRLPALQSQINELLEHARDQGARLEAHVLEFIESENRIRGHVTQAIRQLSATFTQELKSNQRVICNRLKQNAERVEGTSAEGEMPWKLEKRHILRKLELMGSESQSFMHLLRQSVDKSLDRSVLDYKTTFSDSNFGTQFDMSPALGKWDVNEDGYIITVTNIDDVLEFFGKVVGFTRWYRRERYLHLAIGNGTFVCRFLSVFLKWGTTVRRTGTTPQRVLVFVRHPDYPRVEDYPMEAQGDCEVGENLKVR
ncbi:hypothetical protein HPB48_010110 [Haemaphysalis longicornis]|uniref:Uncharacterized protein n=1 Tax=Haemaphysalis longicornis TaxID=44386 RepID=A0A9J6FL21_HAELO|nr:hypothetical protein HPB48_010110 [Haemaphysalis longicornis]